MKILQINLKFILFLSAKTTLTLTKRVVFTKPPES